MAVSPDSLRPDPHPAVNQVRAAVRRFLVDHEVADTIAVACSGGADSLALAAATVHCAAALGLAVHGLVVDHQLQPCSAQVAQTAGAQLRQLGYPVVQILPVTVNAAAGSGGLEAAARRARYQALRDAAPDGAPVLLGHTLDDQAETVLLGLGRGSGPRSVAGMLKLDLPWGRPLLGVRRAVTAAACAALNLEPWTDPHNADPRFRRVRLRTEVLPLLEDVLAGGVAEALARTAQQLREDLDVLDGQAGELFAAALRGPSTDVAPNAQTDADAQPDAGELDVAALTPHPAALRRRVLRRWLLDAGVTGLTDAHLRAGDDLIGHWSGQGAVRLPGAFELARGRGRLHVSR